MCRMRKAGIKQYELSQLPPVVPLPSLYVTCGKCMFISSPSKSALYGVHAHSLKRNVRHGMTYQHGGGGT